VFLDESVQPAQIITGLVQYPPGHPHDVFYAEAYSLGNYLSAAVLQLTHSTWVVSAFRNWLTLFCATFLPFALAVLLTGAPAWGFVASALTLTEAAIAFQGVYPLWVFPASYSTGNTSLHIALLAALLVLAGRQRLGGVLVGMLPAIHPALAVLAWVWTAVFVFVHRQRWPARQLVTLSAALSVGFGACLALGSIVLLQIIRINSSGAAPYTPADIDGNLVRREYIAITDVHRRLFEFPSVAYLLNPAAFAAISSLLVWAAWRRRRTGRSLAGDGYLGWIVMIGGLAWLTIYSAGLFQWVFGSLPDLVGTLMPYRLSNVTALLLIPLAVSGIAASTRDTATRHWLVWGLTGLLLLAAGVRVVQDRDSVFRNGLFVILGVFLGLETGEFHREWRRTVTVVCVVGALGALAWKLGLRHEVVYLLASCLLVSLVLFGSDDVGMRPERGARRMLAPIWGALFALGCAGAILGSSLATSIWDRGDMVFDVYGNPTQRWDAMSAYDWTLDDWLRTHTHPDAMILSGVWPRSELQQKIGHPVLFELETLPNLTYLPTVAASTGEMARDLYSVDYSRPDLLAQNLVDGRLEMYNPVWYAAWQSRTRAEWQALAQKYAFHLVLSPTSVQLDLPVALPGPVWTLYTIP
jgi:hypothetical protein